MKKTLSIISLTVSMLFASSFAMAESVYGGDTQEPLEQAKEKIIERSNERADVSQDLRKEFQNCVSGAADRNGIKDCHEQRQLKIQEQVENNREQRKAAHEQHVEHVQDLRAEDSARRAENGQRREADAQRRKSGMEERRRAREQRYQDTQDRHDRQENRR